MLSEPSLLLLGSDTYKVGVLLPSRHSFNTVLFPFPRVFTASCITSWHTMRAEQREVYSSLLWSSETFGLIGSRSQRFD